MEREGLLATHPSTPELVSAISTNSSDEERTMARRVSVHTTKNPDGSGWVVQSGGEIISHHRFQRTAAERGRAEAIAREAEHVIHGQNGRIRESNSYGGDPCPPRDKR